jgi:hypothetical protein
MNCCICGPVKNCGPYLRKNLANMEQIGSLFDDYKILIYYDHSRDDTLKILKEYQQTNPKMAFYVNKNPVSKYRTHNIANARNFCLDFVKQHIETFPYFIMMDMDDVNCKDLNVEPLRQSLKREDWDGLSFNTSPAYYDIWALSLYPYCFSYNHYENNDKFYKIIQNYVTSMLKNLKPELYLNSLSSFYF